jgi:tRNA(adenine34) deaminase
MSFNPRFMTLALNQAVKAFDSKEVPVGAVVIKNNHIIGMGRNMVISHNSVASHAEIIAINKASQYLNNYRLIGCEIYVTLEPCHMCAKAIVDARISSMYFGAPEPKTGAVQSIDHFLDRGDLNHQVSYSGNHMKRQSAELLKKFFQSRRG